MLNLLSFCQYLPTHAISSNPQSNLSSDTEMETLPEKVIGLGQSHSSRSGEAHVQTEKAPSPAHLGIGLKVVLEHDRGAVREVGESIVTNPWGSCEVPMRTLVASERSRRGLRGVFSCPELGGLGVCAYGPPSWGTSHPHLNKELG